MPITGIELATFTFANDQEIACKTADHDGGSPQAFPDPCWSPPGPTAGPIVIPLPMGPTRSASAARKAPLKIIRTSPPASGTSRRPRPSAKASRPRSSRARRISPNGHSMWCSKDSGCPGTLTWSATTMVPCRAIHRCFPTCRVVGADTTATRSKTASSGHASLKKNRITARAKIPGQKW